MSQRKLLILAGPSAVGKTTVVKRLLSSSDEFGFLRSMTTRPPRTPGDTEYLYVTKEAFERAKAEGALLEYTEYADYAYATPLSEIERINGEGKTPLLILDLVGARTLKESPFGADTFVVYLYDSLDVLQARLIHREMKKEENPEAVENAVKKRTGANIRDYGALAQYKDTLDAFVFGETPEEKAEKITRLFSLFKEGKTAFDTAEKDRVIDTLRKQSAEKSIC